MKIGLIGGIPPGSASGIDVVIAQAQRAEAGGFASYWLPNVLGVDAITALAFAGRETQRIRLGTAVVPLQPRHPLALAQQVLTAQAACRGRFALGIGLSHRVMIENMFGLSFERPVRRTREYLEVLTPLLRGEPAKFAGELYRVNASIQLPEAARVPCLVAALGEQMLRVAGRLADGTITWMTGLRTLASHTVPTLRAAARAAGRPEPEVVAGLPIQLASDIDAARERIGKALAMYDGLPSYRAMLDREGAAGPADIALLGDETALRAALARLRDAGVGELAASVGSGEAAARTRSFLASEMPALA
jgi:F420-dependent oxidoreductase-like protein